MAGDIIELDGKAYYIRDDGTRYWPCIRVTKQFKAFKTANVQYISCLKARYGKILKRGVPFSEVHIQ